MFDKRQTRSLVNEWLVNNSDDTPFNMEEFKVKNSFGDLERDYITDYFRTMCRKLREIQHYAEEVADEIKKIDKLDSKTKESDIMKKNFENRLEIIFGGDKEMALKWFRVKEDERFEILKDLLKKRGIYYRIRSSTNGKEYITPTFNQKYDKQWTTVFSRTRAAIKAVQENCEIFIDQIQGRTINECASSLKVIQVLYEDLKITISLVERKKDMITNDILVLSGGELQPTSSKGIKNEEIYVSDIRKSFKR